jgi:molybdopterin-guanine dinucleotide biosynthesis protein A
VDHPPRAASLVILAGGESRRMGQPKAGLRFGEGTLLDWMIGRLGPAFAEVLVSTNEAMRPPGRARIVPDLHPHAGPLAGIEACLAATTQGAAFVVACDMPLVTAELARAILDGLEGRQAAVPVIGGRPEPACAAYARSAAPIISAALDRGDRRAASILTDLDVNWLDGLDAGLFRNANTPEEYRALLDALL